MEKSYVCFNCGREYDEYEIYMFPIPGSCPSCEEVEDRE